MKKDILFAIAVMAYCGHSFATIINVPDDYPSIQQAMDISQNGDTVLVADGVYYERINFRGKAIQVASVYLIDGDRSHIENTVIDADTLVIGIADTGSAVCFASGEDSMSILRGFTIRNGIGTSVSIYHRMGGGIYCLNSSYPTIADNMISENSATAGGGICCVLNSYAIIRNNVIYDNYGHGIYLSDSEAIIEGNRITSNYEEYGSGIYCNTGSDALIMGNTINENYGSLWGGGIFCNSCDPLIANNVIYENSAVDWGGGICCDNSNALIINNTLTDNTAQGDGGGVYCLNNATPILVNNILWENSTPEIGIRSGGSPIVSYCDISGGWEGIGNIDIDPLFRNQENRDFHLRAEICDDTLDSPCIDMGNPDILDSILDCDWGLGTIVSDMGAYGGDYSATVGIDDLTESLPRFLSLEQNFPNPFNAATTISFTLQNRTDVNISIYNIMGQTVTTLFKGTSEAGEHMVVWNASDFPSGVYFARLETAEHSDNIKMILLK